MSTEAVVSVYGIGGWWASLQKESRACEAGGSSRGEGLLLGWRPAARRVRTRECCSGSGSFSL